MKYFLIEETVIGDDTFLVAREFASAQAAEDMFETTETLGGYVVSTETKLVKTIETTVLVDEEVV